MDETEKKNKVNMIKWKRRWFDEIMSLGLGFHGIRKPLKAKYVHCC